MIIMEKHPKTIKDFEGTFEELAKSIGNMSYDQTSLFIEKLADDIKNQADADSKRGRKQLSDKLYKTSQELYKAKDEMLKAWKICKSHMKK
ncbi:MAG: hypothetical protein PHT94_02055 [Candidatus Nanoarchaeia archaeon]|nr:hypothetical protein [Candidatus Nanoarchaeia archaeon]